MTVALVEDEHTRLLPLKTATRYKIKTSAGLAVTRECSASSEVLHRLPQNTIVVCAEVKADEGGRARARISSPAGWLDAEGLVPAGPPAPLGLDYETFLERHQQVAPGDRYGLEFPFTLELLQQFGTPFLTAAFRASGVIGEDNEVTELVSMTPITTHGASDRALVSVKYAKAEAGLHTELFVKCPPSPVQHKFALSKMSQGEVNMARRSCSPGFPAVTAKYYFGDYSPYTTNYLLITERIAFGEAPIEPAHGKGYDHLVPDAPEHYRVLAVALAKLVAGHKTGAMGYDIEEQFPFAQAARDFHPMPDVPERAARLADFVGRIAPQLFAPEITTPEFLSQWREDVIFGMEHKDRLKEHLHQKVDYTGLCHSNLNIDNAWYWRDDEGNLQVGLLDWGGSGQMSIAQALSSMLMMPEPEAYKAIKDEVIATFVRESAERGSPVLDPEELRFQFKASLFSTAIWLLLGVVGDALLAMPEEQFAGMKDRFDERLQSSGLCSAIVWIENVLAEWLDAYTPGDVCRRIVASN